MLEWNETSSRQVSCPSWQVRHIVTVFPVLIFSALTLHCIEGSQLFKYTIHSIYLVVEEKQSTEKAVQVCCQQGEVDGCRAGFLYDHRHEAIKAKHTGTEANIQQPWEKTEVGTGLSIFHHMSKRHILLLGEDRKKPELFKRQLRTSSRLRRKRALSEGGEGCQLKHSTNSGSNKTNVNFFS